MATDMMEKNDIGYMKPYLDNQYKPLRDCVIIALNNYFKQLNGTVPSELYDMVIGEVEMPLIETVMHYVNGNQSKASEYLGISRGTLRKKLKRYGLD